MHIQMTGMIQKDLVMTLSKLSDQSQVRLHVSLFSCIYNHLYLSTDLEMMSLLLYLLLPVTLFVIIWFSVFFLLIITLLNSGSFSCIFYDFSLRLADTARSCVTSEITPVLRTHNFVFSFCVMSSEYFLCLSNEDVVIATAVLFYYYLCVFATL